MSSIVIQGDTSGSITVEAPSVAGTHTLTLPKATGNIATDATVGLGTKNLIINGDMRIAQRGTSAVVPTDFPVDRFRIVGNQAGKFTAQQSTDVPSNAGFKNSIVLTSSSAYSEASGDYFLLQHRFEGNNVEHLQYGSANARTVTVSFWAKSSLTGTFAGALRDGSSYSTSYIFEYTISSANTWEYKTVTILGATSGTWLTGTSVGAELSFALGGGSSFDGTAGAWQSTPDFITSSANRLVNTNGATLYITGVQLEVGENATPFEHRMYSQELAMCQRYYQPVNAISGTASSTSGLSTNISFAVPMRTTPSISVTSVLKVFDGATTYTQSSVNAGSYLGNEYGGLWYSIANFSGLTQYRPYGLNTNLNNNIIRASAEL